MTTPAPPPEPVLSEHYGGYQTDWYCEPPPMGMSFRVLREEWHNKAEPDKDGVLTYSAETIVRSVYETDYVPPKPGELYVKLEYPWLT